MTSAGAVGLMAIFLGDLANIFFLSRLGDEAVVAAVGYASSIGFFAISIGIGLSIAASALVSPAIGARNIVKARRLSVNAHVITAVVAIAMSAVMMALAGPLLKVLGAEGRTHRLASQYLWIIIPSLLPLAVAMTSTAVLRSVGDARRAMNVTLAGAVVNVVLDPLLIFGAGLGIHGAAIASVLARVAMLAIGLYGVVKVHKLMARPKLRTLVADARPLFSIAVPAMLTNVATPVGNAYVTAAIAPYGDGAVAGWAIIGRVLPVAFGAVYALSGTIGPIVGQNLGAGQMDRVRETLSVALAVTAAFTAVAWAVLAALASPLAAAFNAGGEARDLVMLFCRWLAPLFLFMGALFIANAVFNALGRAHIPTMLNWGRATIGTVPFVIAGGSLAGASGVLAGHMLGGVVFGILAVWLCYRFIDELR